MAFADFDILMRGLTSFAADQPLDERLETTLNDHCGLGSLIFDAVESACREGVEAGWLCSREGGGIRYGRVIKPGPATHGFSVDVVDMKDVVGPHHTHPQGEIDLIMPLDRDAEFDGSGAGWKVYGPGSAHSPTVTDGRALVLYLLPGVAIEFTPAG